ncbi:MFS transporter permease [Azospirillum sp. TSH7]|uniref:MFS transporter n=1 Tax=unclassified Azospirillum TaxID=2630922 RepID=UPI000D61C96F|nr:MULTISPECIES: MFS transporter [unclassified Azospirillum]PWC58492.1 MFS transporter permease [Azospirillum sp. TSH7]PWC72227.1 MFS transporter permease [Azospirillum sp. TSH20]
MTGKGQSSAAKAAPARQRDPISALVLRLTIVTVAVLLVAAGAASWLSLRSFDPLFQPELARKAQTVGGLLAAQIDRGLGVRIPLDRMAGLDALLAAEVDRHDDIAYIAVTDPAGRIVATAGKPLAGLSSVPAGRLSGPADGRLVSGFVDVENPLGGTGASAGALHVGIDSAFLAKASTDLALDVLSVVIVSVLLIFEVLQLVVNLAMRRVLTLRLLADRAEEGDFRATLPVIPEPAGAQSAGANDDRALEGGVRAALDSVNARHAGLAARVAELRRRLGNDDPRVDRAEAGLAALAGRFRFRDPQAATPPPTPLNLVFLRLPVFLFCLSEELSRPFLPAYAKSFAGEVPWLTPDMVVSLPITLFMLIWALSQPGGARFSERWGRARSFTIGALLGSVSLALTAYAGSLFELMLWRCLTALGYGLVLITAQGIVVDHTTPRNRAAGMAMFIGALLAAGVCGPVGGGIIADQAGFRATFLLGAVLALGSGLSVSLLLLRGRSAARPAGAAPRPAMGSALPLFRDFRFSALMVLSAIPTKIASTAFLFCLVPLLLTADGATKAEIGRVQMMYFVAFILVSPLAASLSDRWQARRGFIAAGGIGTLASCLPIVATQALWGPPLAIALFGLSQALVGAPQLTLVSQIAREGGLQETAAIGWYRLIERLGGALGPVTAMAVAVATSYREAMLGIGLLCGASALLFWILFRTGRPATPATRPQEA